MAALAYDRGSSLRDVLLGSLFERAPHPAFMRSGPVAERERAMSSGHAPYGDPSERNAGFTVTEARRRLHELVSGVLKVRSVSDLVSYLKDNFLTPELQSFAGAAKGTLHLRDGITGSSAPAAAVHPLLTERGMRRLAGRDAEQAVPAGPSQMEMRYRDALKVAYRGLTPGYTGWEALKTGLPAALSRSVSLAFTVSNSVSYIGSPGRDARKPLECLGNSARTREMLYAAYAEERRKKGADTPTAERFAALPEDRQKEFLGRHFVFDENMTPRTPVLLRNAMLVEAARVSPALAADRMQAAFGGDFAGFWGRFHRDQISSREASYESSNVVDMHRAVAALRKASPAVAGAASGDIPPGAGFGGVAQGQGVDNGPRTGIVVVTDETSMHPRICRHSPDGEHREMSAYPTLHDLPPGEYRALVLGATWDAPSGWIAVDADRGVTHLDLQRREHNEDGPSHEPAPGSNGDRRWALGGEVMPRAEWELHTGAASAPGHDGEEQRSGFGYGAPQPA